MGIFAKKTRTPADVQADITALHESIAAKESAMRAIEAQVRAAVASGDMQAADAFDTDLVREQQALERLRAREAILAETLATAEEEAKDAAAKAEHERAKAALAVGHSLMHDYEKQAKALAGTLEKLAAVDRFIERVNARVDGRAPTVEGPYRATRYTPPLMADGVERWYEYPGHGPVHPDLGHWLSQDGEAYSRTPPPPLRVDDDENGKPVYVNAVLMSKTVPNAIMVEQQRWANAIDELAKLPGCRIDDLDLWNETRRREAHMKSEQIVSALLEKRKA